MTDGVDRGWTRRTLMLVLASASIGGACGGTSGGVPIVEETTGELGNGTFRWSCVDHNDDPTCGTGIFPSAVALHSRFDLRFTADSEVPTEGSVDVESVSPRRMAEADGGFAAIDVGEVSMLAMSGDYGVDYITLDVRPVDSVLLRERVAPTNCDDVPYYEECEETGPTVGGAVTLRVHEGVDVEAVPFGDGTELAGALPYTWESLSGDLSISSVYGGRARLEGLAEGIVELRVTAGDFTQVLTYEVQPPLPSSEDDDDEGDDVVTEGSGSDGSGTGGSGTEGSGTEGSDTDGSDTDGSDTDGSGTESSGTDGEGASSTGAM